MKIFVTVGTTSFTALIKEVDVQIGALKDYEVEAQIGSSSYIPKNINYYKYTDQIQERIDWADIVITHGGAGTVYNLLEQQKKAIVVPNPKVRGNHQMEIAKFVSENNYATASFELSNLLITLKECDTHVFDEYVNNNASLIHYIHNIIKESS